MVSKLLDLAIGFTLLSVAAYAMWCGYCLIIVFGALT
jgi:hypothetical protein